MSWFRSFLHKAAQEDSFDREISFHLQELIDANVAKGLSTEEARRRALLELGGPEQIKQELREVHASLFFEWLVANLKAAVRFFRKAPSFSIAIVLTLALGIGANSAVFSAIDAILLRPLSFPHGDELVSLSQYNFKNQTPATALAPQRLEDWNRLNSTFQSISGYYTEDTSENSGTLPEKITEALVAPRFLEVWEVAPTLGRNFTPEEERYGGPSAALISNRLWRNHFHSDPEIVGKVIKLDTYSYSIVGVMSASFLFPEHDVDIWVPSPPDAPVAQNRNFTWFHAVGRLKPDVSLEQARADLDSVQKQLGGQYPKTDADLSATIQPLKNLVIGDAGSSLWLLYGSVSLLLLIACTNIAALLLARTTGREHEISIRFSLGASRTAIVTQLLSEIFFLAFLGSTAGLFVALGIIHLSPLIANELPRAEEISLNWQVVGYSFSSALVTTLICGLYPALRGTRRGLTLALAQEARTQVSGRRTIQWFLVSIQVSFAVTLLIGAGLLIRSFQELSRVKPGFDPDHVLSLRISASWGETKDMKGLTQRIDRTLDGLRGIPGVEAAATSAMLPGVPFQYEGEMKVVEGEQDASRKIIAATRFVSEGYFATLHIPLLDGEPCKEGLPLQTALVNRSFSNIYLAGSTGIGLHLQSASTNAFSPAGEIRGLAADVREEGVNSPPVPTVYWCLSAPSPDPYFFIRTHKDPMAMAQTIRHKIHELEPTRSVYDVVPLKQRIGDAFETDRLRTVLLALFALSAIMLVSIGIYGTISYLGRLRQREIGLRLALGALPRQVVVHFLMQALSVTVAGCAVGMIAGVVLRHLLSGMLYGVSLLDRATYLIVPAFVLMVAVFASTIPAVRASQVDPTTALREE